MYTVQCSSFYVSEVTCSVYIYGHVFDVNEDETDSSERCLRML